MIFKFWYWLKRVFRKIKDLANSGRFFFTYGGNLVESNKEEFFVLTTFQFSFEQSNIKSISVTYRDGDTKEFFENAWLLHGRNIMKNCEDIKVIVNEREETKG